MKKSKLSKILVTSFIAAMGLTACGQPVNGKDNAIITYTGYDGKVTDVLTDDIYSSYRRSASGIKTFYEKILEVMIRDEFRKPSEQRLPGLTTSYNSIVAKAENSIEKDKIKANEDHNKNGTSYDSEWNKILESNHCENEAELKEFYIYSYEKEEIENWFLHQNETVLKKEYIGIDTKGNLVKSYKGNDTATERLITQRFPYHIRHILVKSDGSNFTRDTITESVANNLWNVVDKLSSGTSSFGQTALTNSEDEGSGAKYGDVGIVTNKVSSEGSLTMVNEFQFAAYAFDAAITHKADEEGKGIDLIRTNLGLNYALRDNDEKTYADFITEVDGSKNRFAPNTDITGSKVNGVIAGLSEVPFSVFKELKDVSEVTTTLADEDERGYALAENNTSIYPRNILWNKYLNIHNPFLITNRARVDYSSVSFDIQKARPNALGTTWGAEVPALKDERSCGFRKAVDLPVFADIKDSISSEMLVLTDEKLNPIIGVRSTYGIHFMILQKAVSEFYVADGDNKTVSLEDYYTIEVPEKDVSITKEPSYKYPHYIEDGKVINKQTYVNYLDSEDDTKYSSRATEVENAIKGYDQTYDYRLYEFLYDTNKAHIKFNDKGGNLETAIASYIDLQRELNVYNQQKGMEKAWNNYYELLGAQYEERVTRKKVVPEGCMIGFAKKFSQLTDEEKALYAEGGACYYVEK
mgnify:CR=1 FL=1